MDHSEAVRLMATERYLLGELSPEIRDAFEEHFFECQQCALDVRAGSAFVHEARQLLAVPAAVGAVAAAQPTPRREWFSWWKPAFAAPAFAVLLLVMVYQNFATIPSLRSAVRQPRLAPWAATLHVGTRDGAPLPVVASHKSGLTLLIDVPDSSAYSSLGFALQDPQGKQFWTESFPASAANGGQQTLSLSIPGEGLQQGSYTLSISGITAQGGRTQLDRRILDLRFDD
jgi:hypothetical protein